MKQEISLKKIYSAAFRFLLHLYREDRVNDSCVPPWSICYMYWFDTSDHLSICILTCILFFFRIASDPFDNLLIPTDVTQQLYMCVKIQVIRF